MVTINLRYRLLLKFILYKQKPPGKQVFLFFNLIKNYICNTYKKMFTLKVFDIVYFSKII